MRRIPMAIAAGGVVGALGIGGLAYATTTGSSPAATAKTGPSLTHARHARHARWGLLHRAIYARVIVEGKGHVAHTFVFERGLFTSISGGAIHLTLPDGTQASAPITSTTRFRRIPEAKLVPGDRVSVTERDGTTTSVVGHAPRPRKAHTATHANAATTPAT